MSNAGVFYVPVVQLSFTQPPPCGRRQPPADARGWQRVERLSRNCQSAPNPPMTRISSVFCFIALATSGCSSTILLTSALDANRKVGHGAADIILTSGRRYAAHAMCIQTDSTEFIDSGSLDTVRIPTHSIHSIQIVHHGGGALEGLMLGGLGGTAFGLFTTIGTGSSGNASMGKGLWVIATTVVGATGGLVFGAIKGHDYTYICPIDSTSNDRQADKPDTVMSNSQAPVGAP